MVRRLLLVLGLMIATSTTSIFALGLGEIRLKSGLNQPLDAEIVLLSVRGETEDQLRGMLASAADFERAGIERYYFLTKIRFQTITKANGQKVLKLTTDEPVKEPFLNFLVDLEWPNGRLLREYTLLLDPPIFDDSPSSTVTPAASVQEPAPATVVEQPVEQARPAPSQSTPSFDGDVYGPTDSNDTLWNIAKKVRPNTSVSMHQAMIALYEANPKAFMRGNINNLKRGATLRIPDEAGFKQISQRDALRMIAAHNQAWKSGTSVPKVVVDTSEGTDYQTPTSSTTSSSGRLSLVTEDESTGPGSASSALIEEENEVLKQQNDQLQNQLETVKKQLEEQQRLLELQNEQLATIQNKDAEPANESETSDSQSNTNAQTPEAATPEPQTPEQTNPVNQTPITQPEPSFIDSIMAGAYNMYLIVLGLIILVIGGFVMFRKSDDEIDYQDAVPVSKPTKSKAQELDELEEVADETQSAEDIFPESADDIVSAEEDPFEQLAAEDEDEADPLGEADIYIAYGKYEQAEALLEQAIEQQPERIELSTKLLECYAEMNDELKFANRVEHLKVAMQSDSELASHIKELYSTAWPQGQLFEEQATDQEPVQEAADELETDDIPSTEDVFGEVEQVADEVEDLPVETEELDIDLGEDDMSLEDFVNEQLDEEPTEEAEQAAETVEQQEQPEQEDQQDPYQSSEVAPKDRHLDEDDEDDDDGDDYINTQLDLAKAYVEMGDVEGTREILEEVMSEGNEKQKAKAQKILDSLG